MGKRVVDDASLYALAGELRAASGQSGEMVFPDGFVAGARASHVAGYEKGLAECAAKHFVHNFVGDGSGSVSVHIPFEPDKIFIINLNPLVQMHENEIAFLSADLRAFGRYSGLFSLGLGSSLGYAVYTTKSFPGARYSRDEDGTITLTGLNTTANNYGVFTNGATFLLVAVKHLDQTDKELITEFVESLTGSGTVEINKAKVDANFTSAEWSALIATKPSWTFTMYS